MRHLLCLIEGLVIYGQPEIDSNVYGISRTDEQAHWAVANTFYCARPLRSCSAQCEAPVTHCNLPQSEAFTFTTAATMASRKASFEES